MTEKIPSPLPTLASAIAQAERELISPIKFYNLCRNIRKRIGNKRLYFYAPDRNLLDERRGIGTRELRRFFDYLAKYIIQTGTEGQSRIFYLRRVRLRVKHQVKRAVLLEKLAADSGENFSKKGMKIEVEIAGSGMVGRVARVRINRGDNLAFKAFFDPNFIWLHGPWGEIPVGIRLKACHVTKDMPEFFFAGQDWAVWEWIYPDTKPELRTTGITYEQFARTEGLTRLNPLNLNNYNPHNMRIDPGGIQKEYWGRRILDFYKGTIFYARKARREGLKSLTPYLRLAMIRYALRRLVALVLPVGKRRKQERQKVVASLPKQFY
jgi:hypothetical protein